MPVVRKLETAGVQPRKPIPAIRQIDNTPRVLRSGLETTMDCTASADSDPSGGEADRPAAA
jgi:hypothetical protein